jgi:hypothetical protein
LSGWRKGVGRNGGSQAGNSPPRKIGDTRLFYFVAYGRANKRADQPLGWGQNRFPRSITDLRGHAGHRLRLMLRRSGILIVVIGNLGPVRGGRLGLVGQIVASGGVRKEQRI